MNHTLCKRKRSEPCFSKGKSHVKQSSPKALLKETIDFCTSEKLPRFVEKFLPCFENVRFEMNTDDSKFLSFFEAAFKNFPDDSELAIVFHGTPEKNVSTILKDGLDPKKRSGQAHGPGEYFGRDPSVSLSYCYERRRMVHPMFHPMGLPMDNPMGHQMDLQMLVFLVVVPAPNQRYPRRPYNCVVVENNAHQLPLGVLHLHCGDLASLTGGAAFVGSKSAPSAVPSPPKESKLMKLARDLEAQKRVTTQSKIRASIIQILIKQPGAVDKASRMYKKNEEALSHLEQREISTFVHLKLDAALIPYYFPGLPKPMTNAERNECKDLNSVEFNENKVSELQAEYSKEKKENAKKENAKKENAKETIRQLSQIVSDPGVPENLTMPAAPKATSPSKPMPSNRQKPSKRIKKDHPEIDFVATSLKPLSVH